MIVMRPYLTCRWIFAPSAISSLNLPLAVIVRDLPLKRVSTSRAAWEARVGGNSRLRWVWAQINAVELKNVLVWSRAEVERVVARYTERIVDQGLLLSGVERLGACGGAQAEGEQVEKLHVALYSALHLLVGRKGLWVWRGKYCDVKGSEDGRDVQVRYQTSCANAGLMT